MSLMDAPAYNAAQERRAQYLWIGSGVLVAVLLLLTLLGYILGHGWLFTNLGAEHRVDRFFNALQARDYAKAYDIYSDGHPDPAYPLNRFTEDWTTYSPIKAPITSHHVDISRTDGTGPFGTGIIVAVRVNGNQKLFMYVNKKDGTMTASSPHVLQYGSDTP